MKRLVLYLLMFVVLAAGCTTEAERKQMRAASTASMLIVTSLLDVKLFCELMRAGSDSENVLTGAQAAVAEADE